MTQDVTAINCKEHIEGRLVELQDFISVQKCSFRKYLIIYNTLILISLLSSCTVSILEIFCPFSTISCCVTVLGVLSSLSVGALSKFNIGSKKDACKQNIVTLKNIRSEAKRLLLYGDLITQADMKRLFEKLDRFI